MRRPIEVRKGARLWHVHVAPDLRLPAVYWGAYGRETFAEAVALVNEVIAGGRAYLLARKAARASQGNDEGEQGDAGRG